MYYNNQSTYIFTELLNVYYNFINTIDLLEKKNKIYISRKDLK